MKKKSGYSAGNEWQHSRAMPAKAAIQKAGHEMKENPPEILRKTAAKKGRAAAHKQKVAIMLNKARRGK